MKYWGVRGAILGWIWGLLLGAGFSWCPASVRCWWPDRSRGRGNGIGIGGCDGWAFSSRGGTHSSWRSQRGCHQVRKRDHCRQVPSDCQRHAGGAGASAPHPRNSFGRLTDSESRTARRQREMMGSAGRKGWIAAGRDINREWPENRRANNGRSLPGQMLRRNLQSLTGWGYWDSFRISTPPTRTIRRFFTPVLDWARTF